MAADALGRRARINHAILGPSMTGGIDPDRISAAIASGRLEELDRCLPDVQRNAWEAPVAEVGDILDMWSAIERGYKRLSAEEKEQVEAEAGPLGRGVRFSGFDGDTECEYRNIARHVIEETGQFERFQGRKLDSSMPQLDGYRRMLRLFGPMRPSTGDCRLGVRQIIELANAEKYAG
jgi:uncharacterized protein YfbU (UPF0304 family)